MKEKKSYTFKLPVKLMEQIDKLVINRDEFVILALREALQPKPQNKDEIIKRPENYDDEYLNRYIDKLETDLEFWKDKYEVLQLEYYDQVRDSIKRLDSKFERVMFSIDESKREPLLESVSLKPKFTAEEPHKKKDIDIPNEKTPDESHDNDFQDEINDIIQALKEREANMDEEKEFLKNKGNKKKQKDSLF